MPGSGLSGFEANGWLFIFYVFIDYLVTVELSAHMALKYDMTGQRFGRLLVAEYIGSGRFRCECDCGNFKSNIFGSDLRRGRRHSCGCIRREKHHEMYGTGPYKSWQHARDRTTNKDHKNWALYGGRGIFMCEEWINSFAAFFKDMGPKPTPSHSLDRIDTNGPYSPQNCRWATIREQSRNKRNNVLITIDGETKIMEDWASHFGINSETFRRRIANKNHPSSWIVSRPIKKKG